jgi:hypothetical protein
VIEGVGAVAMFLVAMASVTNLTESPESWRARADKLKAKGINGNGAGVPLTVAVRMYPTPMARDAANRSGQAKRYLEQGRVNLQDRLAADGVRGSLNPTWVEWLMGFPLGWTVCEFWETRSSRRSRR